MTLLRNATISAKIVALLMLLGGVTLFVAGFGASRLTTANATYAGVVSEQLPLLLLQSRIHQRMTGMMYNAYQTAAYDSASPLARKAADQAETDYRMALVRLGEAEQIARGNPMTSRIRSDVDAVHAITARAAALALAGHRDAATRALQAGDAMDKAYSPTIRKYLDANVARNTQLAAELGASAATAHRTLWLLAIGSTVGAIALAVYIVRVGITGPLSRLQTQMGDLVAGNFAAPIAGADRGDEVGAMAKVVRVFREHGIAKQSADAAGAAALAEQQMVVATLAAHLAELSGGDLTAAIDADFPPDYATLKVNFNEALDKLRALIGSVTESAAAIRTGSVEIAQASEDLARRTESNAASLEETAAAVTQMDGRLRASATAATNTVGRADQAIATVDGGRAVADEAVQAMGRVSDSAKGIDTVIEGLDKIAFQTRVLAMNAAVEAGRAGEAGRGFAVVADLVSALAMRAEEEAKRARDQLTVTQSEVVVAVQAVQKVNRALSDIAGDVGQVHELLATMATDNLAQSAAITQISSAIGAMDRSTQQNAAMVEETSAAARTLSSEVGTLADQAARFDVGQVAAATPARSPRPVSRLAVTATSLARPLPAAAIAAHARHDGAATGGRSHHASA